MAGASRPRAPARRRYWTLIASPFLETEKRLGLPVEQGGGSTCGDLARRFHSIWGRVPHVAQQLMVAVPRFVLLSCTRSVDMNKFRLFPCPCPWGTQSLRNWPEPFDSRW